MATKSVTTSEDWRELEKRADAMVPADIAERIPVRVTDEGRAVRIGKSRVTLPVLIGLYQNGDDVQFLANEAFPHFDQGDIQAVIDYYESSDGAWIDPYIEVINAAAKLSHEDHKRRWEAGEFGPRRFGAESSNGTSE